MENEEYACKLCETVFSVEITEEGNLGLDIDFCPVCGNELHDDDVSNNEYLKFIDTDEDDEDE